jgi:hypothetical protein
MRLGGGLVAIGASDGAKGTSLDLDPEQDRPSAPNVTQGRLA